MAIFRVVKDKNNSYVMVNKFGIYDERLSWKAKGILFYCLSRPDDWQFHDNEIMKHAKDGIDGTRSGIKELIKFKYIKKITSRDEKGQFMKSVYEIYEHPYDSLQFEEEEEITSMESSSKEEISFVENPQKDNTPSKENQQRENIHNGKADSSISLEEKSNKENPTLLNNNKLNNDLTNKRILLNNNTTNTTTSSIGSDTIEGKVIEVCKYYEKAGFSSINSIIIDKVGALVDIYTYEWVIKAIDTAVLNNRRSLNYVEGILKRWRANGQDKGSRYQVTEEFGLRNGNYEELDDGIGYGEDIDDSELI